MMKRLFGSMALLALFGGGQAQADPIIYTETGTVSVSVNGGAYNNQTVTLTGYANTASVVGPGTLSNGDTGYDVVLTNATISGESFATASFKDTIVVIDDNTQSAFAFVDANASYSYVLGAASTAFATYNLKTSIGPITPTQEQTAPGSPQFNLVGGNYLQFQGSVTPGTVTAVTPEPASIVMVGLAGAMALGFRQVRARRAAKLS